MGIQEKKKNHLNEKFQIKCYYKDKIDPKNFGKIDLLLLLLTWGYNDYVYVCIQNNTYNIVII